MPPNQQNALAPISSTLKSLGRCLGIMGAVIMMAAGVISYFLWAPQIVLILCGFGLLFAVIGFGLTIAFRAANQSLDLASFDVRDGQLLNVARELRRPLFPWLARVVGVGLIGAPVIVAARFGKLWSLVGLIFPIALVVTVASASFIRKYDTVKKALISRLSESERRQLLFGMNSKEPESGSH